MLLDNRLSPITNQIGFIKSSLASIGSHYNNKFQGYFLVEHIRSSEGFYNIILNLEPLEYYPFKEIYLETKSEWLSYFSNAFSGADAIRRIPYLCREIKTKGLVVKYSFVGDKHSIISFELFGPEDKDFLNYERTITVSKTDGKWQFILTGTQQPFEKPEYYTARKINERFTLKILLEYCNALGIQPFKEDFYGKIGILADAILDEKMKQQREIAEKFNLHELRKRQGI